MRLHARRLAAILRRNPTAADAALTAVLAATALVSVYSTFELLRQDPAFADPAKPWILLTVLAVMLPLALRRRIPLTAACLVIGAFVIGRLVSHPDVPVMAGWEGTMTVWACWIALYSAVRARPAGAAHGARRRRARGRDARRGRARDLLLRGRRLRPAARSTRPSCSPTTSRRSPSRSCSASRCAPAVSASTSSRRGRGSCRASARRTRGAPSWRSACASRASSTTWSPTTSA